MHTFLLLALAAFAQDKAVHWKGNFDEALKEAKKDGKFVVVHFTGSG